MLPPLSSLSSLCCVYMWPAAQGAGAGLLGACLPPARSPSARVAPPGRDQNMSSSCLVPRGEQAGPAWNCMSPSSGNVLRLSNVSPGQPPRGCLAWDFRQLPSRWMGWGGLWGLVWRVKSHRPIFFHPGLGPAQLTPRHPNCPFRGRCPAATGPQRGQQRGRSSDLSGGWRCQGHLPRAGVARGRAGSSQEARGGAERRCHTQARWKYPVLGQGPRPSTDSKERSDVSPGEGLLALLRDDGWSLSGDPPGQSASPRRGRAPEGFQPLWQHPPHPTPWCPFCGSDTGSCAEVGLKGPVT